MPQQLYLQGGDIAAFGATSSAGSGIATTAQVTAASALVDAYLSRREGLIFGSDFNNFPAYMAGCDALATGTVASGILPGPNVPVAITGAYVTQDQVGEPVLLDRAGNGDTEVCVIAAVAGSVLTLASVQQSHAAGCAVEFGMLIAEERQLPANRALTRVAQLPITRIVCGSGRYAYGRRSQQTMGLDQEFNLLADLAAIGGPPLWMPLDVTLISASMAGDVWVPPGLYMANYTEVRLRYVAGWTYASLPSAIKQATANIVNAQANNVITPQLRSYTVGPLQSARFGPTDLDNDTRALLNPFAARSFF